MGISVPSLQKPSFPTAGVNIMNIPEELAMRGFYVFPTRGKQPLVKWSQASTIDPAIISQWVVKYHDCDWGIDCGKSGLVVLDDDRGKNKQAVKSLLSLELENGDLPFTFTVQTQSGGRHYYYFGDARNSNNKLGPGLDIRGVGGFVVAPGSRGYDILQSSEIVDAPQWLIDLAGAPIERQTPETPSTIPLDPPASIAKATSYLQTAFAAAQGQGGDTLTYKTACKVRDMGVSMDKCFALMLDYWNDRCIPPWSPDELQSKIMNAYHYAKKPPANDSPDAAFTEYTPEELPSKPSLFVEANALLARKIKVNYLVRGLLETPTTGLIFGDSTAGKSFIAIDLSLAVACKTHWLNHDAADGAVIYFAGEGRSGIQRRVAAWCKHYKIAPPPNRMFVSEQRIEFSAKSLKAAADEMMAIESLAGVPIKLVIVDTLARHMPGDHDENSAKDMGAFINACDAIRDRFKCVLAVVHHTGKLNKETSRGSSALRGAMDWELKVIEKKGLRAAVFTKQKEGELPPPIGFRLMDVELGFDEDSGDMVKSAVPIVCEYNPAGDKAANLSSDAKLALSILQFDASRYGKGKLEEKVWKKAFYEALGDGVSDSNKRQKFSRIRRELTESVTIKCENGFVVESALNAVDIEE
jgi:hypothetical protein